MSSERRVRSATGLTERGHVRGKRSLRRAGRRVRALPPRPAYPGTRPPELIKAANTAGHADNAVLSDVQNSFN